MSSTSPTSSVFSPHPQGYGSSVKYEDYPEIPRSSYDDRSPPDHYDAFGRLTTSTTSTTTSAPQQFGDNDQHDSKGGIKGEGKARLRKACDSCSVRKVKCDESGPPCKSCAALEIPCTFTRPSRRRGPPNRHAEAIKRQKLNEEGSYSLAAAEGAPGSPTHDAAYSLAALSLPMSQAVATATPATLSAESICDLATIELLIDDYFIFIHPLIPLPHEPTFRAAFAARADTHDRTFLALLAAMLEALVASFPRRPRQLFTSEAARREFPNAGAVIDRCHLVFVQARGLGFLDRDLTMYDAVGSYLAGLAAAYLFDIRRMRLYFGECVLVLRLRGLHKPPQDQTDPDMRSPGDGMEGNGHGTQVNYIDQEMGARLFWLCFVGSMSVRQLGGSDGDLLMPPLSHAERLPPLPLEVDDEYILEDQILQQPVGHVSSLTGFNLNVAVFRAHHALSALEMAFGVDELFDWDRQRRVIRQALHKVKAATANAPPKLQLIPTDSEGAWPPAPQTPSAFSHLLDGRKDPDVDVVGLSRHDSRRGSTSLPYPKRAVQYEIQKANIYASQLATRSYLVEKFWNLYEVHDQRGPSETVTPFSSSPTAVCVAAGVDYRYQMRSAQTPSDQLDAGEQAMAVEREDIVRDLATLLRSINQVNMEPNGLSFCNKIRQVASTLLHTPRARMAMPTLDSEAVTSYLLGFLDILTKLERLGPGMIRGSMSSSEGGATPTIEDVEQEELVHWASLKQHQEKFVQANGFVAGL